MAAPNISDVFTRLSNDDKMLLDKDFKCILKLKITVKAHIELKVVLYKQK